MSIRSSKKNAKARQAADRIERVRQASDYAAVIVETISEPLLVLDDETRVLTASDGFYQAFRTSPAVTVGKLLFELGDGQWDIPRLRQLLSDLPKNNKIEDLAVEHDFPAIGPRRLSLKVRQIDYGAGTRIVLIAIKDITTTAEARRVIEESEATTQALLESASQAILAIDRAGTIRIANRMSETMSGYSRDEMLGQPLEILLPERFWKSHEVHREEFFSAPRTRPMGLGLNLSGRRKDGTEFPVEVSLSYVEAKDGMLAACFVSDISERKKSEAAALRYQQELRALTARLISAQEVNNRYVARELHDVISQKLAVLGMGIAALEQRPPDRNQLRQFAEQIAGWAKDAHQMSRQLHPVILDDLGLAAALHSECLAFSEQHGIPVEFGARNVEGPIPEDVSLCLYRVAQECLRNIAKHSGADAVRVALTGGSREITLVIEDAGQGFELEQVRGKGGLGLVSMDERVRLVDGTFSIQSASRKGTRVEARIPWPRRET